MTITDLDWRLIVCSECYPRCQMERRSHAPMHKQWEHGVLIPADILRRHGPRLQQVVRIAAYDDPVPLRRLAYAAAQVARREGGWDFVSFPYPARGDYYGSGPEARGHLYVEGGRVVGYLVVYVEQRNWDRPHAILGPLWVAAAHRRRGIGRQLFAAAIADAEAFGTPPAWLAPFTATGERFVEAVDPDRRILRSW
jgi:GNAT superfamily N-acetyltransferase